MASPTERTAMQSNVPTAADMARAMFDLRVGRITVDEARAIMRASRAARSETEHERTKFAAFARIEAAR